MAAQQARRARSSAAAAPSCPWVQVMAASMSPTTFQGCIAPEKSCTLVKTLRAKAAEAVGQHHKGAGDGEGLHLPGDGGGLLARLLAHVSPPRTD